MFTSFFGDIKRAWVAFGGIALALVLLSVQVWTAATLAGLLNVFGHLVQNVDSTASAREIRTGLVVYYALMYKVGALYIIFWLVECSLNLLQRMYSLCWRTAITSHFLGHWSATSTTLEGSSQRLTDAVIRFTQFAPDMFKQVARALLAGITFAYMLWGLSSQFECEIYGWRTHGILLWAALGFSIAGTAVTWWIGRPLVKLRAEVQKHESRFRTKLVLLTRGAENADTTREDVLLSFNEVYRKNLRLHLRSFVFDLWFSFYKQAWGYYPTRLLGQFVIVGITGYGAMMQAVAALNEARGAMSVLSDIMFDLTDLLSCYARARELGETLDQDCVESKPIE